MVAFYNRQANMDALVAEMKAKGYNDNAIAGMLGRAQRESSFNTSIRNPNDAGTGKDSVGLFQWNRQRKAGLEKFAADNGMKWNDPGTQAKYAVWEFTDGPEKATGERLRNANNLTDGVNAAMLYTRPKGSVTKIDGKWVPTPQNGLHYKETMASAGQMMRMLTGKDYTPDPAQNQVVADATTTPAVNPAATANPDAKYQFAKEGSPIQNIVNMFTGQKTVDTPDVKPDPEGTPPSEKKDTPFDLHLPDKLGPIKTDRLLKGVSNMAAMSQAAADQFNANVPQGGLLQGAQPIKMNQLQANAVPASGLLGNTLAPGMTPMTPMVQKNQMTQMAQMTGLDSEAKRKQLLAMLARGGLGGLL